MGTVGAILVKELRVEFRNKQVINLYLILVVLLLAAFRFAFEAAESPLDDLASPVLWITIFLSGIFSLTPTYKREVEQSTREGLLLAPVSPSSVYLGKLVANLVVVFLLEVFALVLFFAFFGYPLPAHPEAFLAVLVFGTLGFVVLGNIISAISSNVAQSELMLPVLLVPLLLFTVVLPAVTATTKVFEGASVDEISDQLKLLAAFVTIYSAIGYLSIEYILEA